MREPIRFKVKRRARQSERLGSSSQGAGARLPVLKGELVNERSGWAYCAMAGWPELARLLWPCGEGRFVCKGAL